MLQFDRIGAFFLLICRKSPYNFDYNRNYNKNTYIVSTIVETIVKNTNFIDYNRNSS